jgi:5-methylcytosine-specific restriction endonuclease McrA
MSDWHDSPEWRKARSYAKTILEPICAICGKELHGFDWTIDHISAPGSGEPNHDINNLQSACRSCNGRKQDKTAQRITWVNNRWIK